MSNHVRSSSELSQDDRVIQDIQKKIIREKVIVQGATALRKSTSNVSVQQKCDTNIREAQKNIEYLEERLEQLHIRKRNSFNAQNSNTSPDLNPSSSFLNPNSSPNSNHNRLGSSDNTPAVRPNFTRLDLIKYDTPYLGPRIQLMLQQLEFKLSVENKYQKGIDKMINLYQMEGDKRSKTEAEGKLLESSQKIQLLSKSLKRYSDMHIDFEEDFGEDESLVHANLRRPLTGKLHIVCHEVKDVDHYATARPTKLPESFITIKVEDQTRAKTRTSRNDHWADEFDFMVDKANEIELALYDRSGDKDCPIALLWLRISDIAEAIRRKKVEQELNPGWVSASKVQSGSHHPFSAPGGGHSGPNGGHGHKSSGSIPYNHPNPFSNNSNQDAKNITIDAWFVLEPVGRIHLSLGFEKTNRGPRHENNGGLGRQGAIRQKKEEVHEMHGHKFVQQNFYSIMRCALCGDFLKYSGGYQCLDCKYTCHKKCYPRVVTKCISKASTETDPDEEKLNHRIPHRFEPVTNMSANWCCHCGYMLPLGKKNVRKCTICSLTAHAHCVHFIPDFCGMSPEMAGRIIAEIKHTKTKQAHQKSNSAGTIPPFVISPASPRAQQQQQQQPPYISPQASSPVYTSPTSRPTSGSNQGFYQQPYNQPLQDQHPPQEQPYSAVDATSPYQQSQPLHSQAGYYQHQPNDTSPPKISSPTSSHRAPVKRKEVGAQGLTPSSPKFSSSSDITLDSTKSQTSSFATTENTVNTVNIQGSSHHQEAHTMLSPQFQYQQPSHTDQKFISNNQLQPSTSHQPLPSQSPIQHNHASLSPQPQKIVQHTADVVSTPKPQQPLSYDRDSSQQITNVLDSSANPFTHQSSHMDAVTPTADNHVSAPLSPSQQQQQQIKQYQYQLQSKIKQQAPRRRKVGLDDFNFLSVLGKGNFGKVMLAESRQTKNLYAIKVLKKDFIIENDEVESTRSEKRVLLIANKEKHPFLLSLHSCFQTENRIYFVMEYISGGDLMWHIQQVPFTPRRAQFYAAEVLLALQYFHENGVIYRDLKLDNILLTLEGHVKIADYGLCKEEMWYGNTTGTFCGTPEFMAPEILSEQKYGRAVDWWAFGVLIYQMLLGQSPFRGDDDDEIFDAILSDEPLYPIHMARDSVSILQGLLTRDPQKRLGSSPNDGKDIMEHAYFQNINFDDIYHCRVPPPFIPHIESPTDVRNFDQEFTSEVPALTPVNSTLTAEMQEKFRGFSYLSDDVV